MKPLQPFLTSVIFLLATLHLMSQCMESPPGSGNFVNTQGGPCVNTVITAVPFLTIASDARSAGMGDARIAISPDANALHFNSSKLVWSKATGGIGLTYNAWLRNVRTGSFLLDGAAYTKLGEDQAIGISFRYFNLDEWIATSPTGTTSTNTPKELALSLSYARKIGSHLSAGLSGKFIYSDLVSEIIIPEYQPGASVAFDLSMTYQKDNWTAGLLISNIGSKISYTHSINKDFIPTNLGIGIAWNKTLSSKHQLTLTMDANKLLVPTPDPEQTDVNGDGVPDYKQVSVIKGIFNSFGDAPGGFEEEWSEFNFSWGAEYWYKQVFALRTGYFHEPTTKGGRQYATFGIGGKLHSFGLNISYLVPTNNREALRKTFRASVLYNFEDH